MKFKALPPQEFLIECFNYDPDTGVVTWKHRPLHHFNRLCTHTTFNKTFAGKIAGYTNSKGYWKVKLNNAPYYLHRIVWKIVYGLDPENQIDHVDLHKENLILANLRDATHSENQWNRTAYTGNKTGFKGVSFHTQDKNYVATIQVNGSQQRLGSFGTKELAHAAYRKAANELHGEFANHGH